jgi:hypothetical protein
MFELNRVRHSLWLSELQRSARDISCPAPRFGRLLKTAGRCVREARGHKKTPQPVRVTALGTGCLQMVQRVEACVPGRSNSRRWASRLASVRLSPTSASMRSSRAIRARRSRRIVRMRTRRLIRPVWAGTEPVEWAKVVSVRVLMIISFGKKLSGGKKPSDSDWLLGLASGAGFWGWLLGLAFGF